MFYLSVFLIVLMAFVVMVLVPRGRMQRRAAGILQNLSDYEETSCYLRFSSIWPWRKKWAMEAKIAEMAGEGWIFFEGRRSPSAEDPRLLGRRSPTPFCARQKKRPELGR